MPKRSSSSRAGTTTRTCEIRADGGGVEAAPTAKEANEGSNVHIVNVLDPGMFEQYMASNAGQKTLMNVISRNPQVIKNIVGS